ncbi:MAG: hypothetical protein JW725_00010 [Candidatus Babeliaceae bacterium]|nr:hypothetical protein [Candidatus Babeliaceae bacterium]
MKCVDQCYGRIHLLEYIEKCTFINERMANKALVLTAPALSNFGIIARSKRFGGNVGAFLPHWARERRHNAGVSNAPCRTKLLSWCQVSPKAFRHARAISKVVDKNALLL